MSNDTTDIPNEHRRQFLRQAARWTVALALGGGIAAVTSRRPPGCERGECDSCAIRGECRLQAKNEQRK